MLAAPELMLAAKKLISAVGARGGAATLDTSARLAVGGAGTLASIFKRGDQALAALDKAQVILMVAAEPRYSHTPLWVAVRQAQRRGAKLIVVDSRRTKLARLADEHLAPQPGRDAEALLAVATAIVKGAIGSDSDQSGIKGDSLDRAVKLLDAGQIAAIVGTSPLQYSNASTYVEALQLLDQKADLISYLFPASDSAVLTAYDIGPNTSPDKAPSVEVGDLVSGQAKPDVLYLAADTPFAKRPECGFLIVQDLMQLPAELEADLVLPATPFDTQATDASRDGALPDQNVFDGIIAALGNAGDSNDAAFSAKTEIKEASDQVRQDAEKAVKTDSQQSFLLVREISPLGFRGFGLNRVLNGFGDLGLSGLRIHPEDAATLGVNAGDEVVVVRDGAQISGRALLDPSIPRQTAYAVVDPAAGIPYPLVPGPFAANPCAVEIKRVGPA